jgi:hypothetical protein
VPALSIVMVLAFTAGVFPPLLLVPLELPQPAILLSPMIAIVSAGMRMILCEKSRAILLLPQNTLNS